MRLREITMAGMILLMLAFFISPVNAQDEGAEDIPLVDDIEPEEKIIGPDHILYKLSLAFEDLDVAFTFNDSEKVGKQVSQARHRLAEIKAALKNNNKKAAESAIDQYQEETEQAEETISRLTGKDTGMIRAQARIANHSYVLERLIESHPNNTGLLRAYNNSEMLLVKFATKTNIKLERKTDKMGRKVIRHVRVDDDESGEYEKTSLKASVEDNKTHVKVELKFVTNSTEDAEIAGDILERINAIEGNVSGIIKIERDDGADDSEEDDAEPEVTVTGGPTTTLTPSREKMKAEAEVKGNTTRVKFEYSFFLNETEDPAIIIGVETKLSGLTVDKILNALDVKVKESREEIEDIKRDDRKKVAIEDTEPENRKGQIDRRDSKGSEDD